jgi:hypothetical protein
VLNYYLIIINSNQNMLMFYLTIIIISIIFDRNIVEEFLILLCLGFYEKKIQCCESHACFDILTFENLIYHYLSLLLDYHQRLI